MRKIFTLFILLLLLPVTALAEGAAPDNLYVGDRVLPVGRDSYWTTDKSTGGLTEYKGNDDNWNVKYEYSTVTLTLKNATIEGVLNDVNTAGTGIYAASSLGAVSLNIFLEGENRVSGGHGINVSSGKAASLSISGSGSLTVSATAMNGVGILVQAQYDANLTINGANVNAVVTETNGRGVELSTGQVGNPNLTIEVKGGSLQASGQPNGIKFFTSANNTYANANLKVSGNAMVKTSGITTEADGSGSQGAVLTTEAGTGETGGIVFNGSEGTVYGDVTLQEDLEIGEGESLTIPQGASLDTNGKLTVNGGTLNGTPSGSVTYKVTGVSLSLNTLTLDVGDEGTLTATITPDNASNKSINWESSDTGVATVDANGKVTAVSVGSTAITATAADGSGKSATCSVTVNAKPTYTITADVTPSVAGTATADKTTAAAGAIVTLTATANPGYRFTGWTSSNEGVTFDDPSSVSTTFTMPAGDVAVTAQFEKVVTSVSLNKNTLELYAGQSETLIATVTPDDATNQNVTWSSDNEAVATVDNSGKVTAVTAGEANITVKTEDGNYTASCKVQVWKPATVEPSGSTNLSFTTDRDEFTLTATVHAQGNDLDPKDDSWTWAVADEDVVALSGSPTLLRAFVSSSRQAFTVEGTGTTTITATYDDGTYRGLVEFKVSISKPTPPDPISYYNIYVEDVCDGVEVSTSKQVVREGGSVSVYVKKDTVNYTFDNFKVYYKRSYYGGWEELKEGTQPGEYPIKNIWTHIYIKAEGAEEKEDPTGIESIEGVKVYTKDGSLYVQTPQREQVIIVSMSGAVVKNEEQVGLKQYHGLQPGIYIVRVGDRAYKLRLN